MQTLANKLAPYAPTALRVALGLVFLLHASMKLFVYTLPGTGAFFAQHGFPAWTAWPVFLAEAVGGVALIAGLGTRYVVLVLVPIMVGAIKPHLANGAAFDSPGGGYEMPMLVLVLLGVQFALGSGAWAIDNVIGARTGRNPARGSVITAA
ncbi:MAG: DoxX family protein [Kofleriaceae bacterium]